MTRYDIKWSDRGGANHCRAEDKDDGDRNCRGEDKDDGDDRKCRGEDKDDGDNNSMVVRITNAGVRTRTMAIEKAVLRSRTMVIKMQGWGR